ncbi:MAG: ABC transporter permease [Ilumatobacteraceae bacterium]
MSGILHQFRRAPGRILASVFALALAVGAIGVLAVPTVAGGTLHSAAERGGLADIVVATTPLDADQIARVAALDGVAAAEGEAVLAVTTAAATETDLIGLDFDQQTMDVIELTAGRMPADGHEIVTSPGFGEVGDRVVVDDTSFEIVGNGGTLWWSDSAVAYADLDSVVARTGGTTRLVITAVDDGADELRAIADATRDVLAERGDAFTEFPVYLPDGSTPIDADIEQVSTLIGLLGVVAGLVALVLLASTTNTLITERTREVAVMRALGGRARPLRRRLRSIALAITAVALAVGLPLGVLISNLIARMVLQEFVGVTPDVAIDWWVVAASAIGAIVGARLVAARAAARVTRRPLAEALRDRDGSPYGHSVTQRFAARVPTGGLFGRLAARASIRRPARTVAILVQIAAAVAAAFLVPSLVTSVNGFNDATTAPWTWESLTEARDPGLPFEVAALANRGDVEAGVYSFGEIDDWEVDVFGFGPDTKYFQSELASGRWPSAGSREAMLSAGFADRRGHHVGDTITIDLASGPVDYLIVGTAQDAGRALYADRDVLAVDLGAPGGANVIWSSDPAPSLDLPVSTTVTTADELAAESRASRDAIVMVFGAIGIIVAGVAALAVISSMTVSLYERRHELAALQAIGARRRRLRGLLARELVPIGLLGVAGGLALGALGTRGIIGSFEASNAVDIGVVDATAAIPFIIVGTVAVLVLLATVVTRSVGRRPLAVTLRGAA